MDTGQDEMKNVIIKCEYNSYLKLHLFFSNLWFCYLFIYENFPL